MIGVSRSIDTPGSWTIVAFVAVPGPMRSVMAARSVRWPKGVSEAEPPPMQRSMAAFGPMTATVRSDDGSNGQHRCPARVVIAQEHGARDRRASGQRSFGWIVDGRLGDVGGAFVGVGAVGEEQQVADEAVDLGLVDLAALDRVDELVAVDAHRSGHLQAEPCVGGRGGLVDAVPVRDDEPVETPLVAQDVGQQSAVLARSVRRRAGCRRS